MSDKPFFLITGTGSSGTRYAATVLRGAGLNVRHEVYGGVDGLSSWYVGVPKAIYRPDDVLPKYFLPPRGAMTWEDFPKDRKIIVLHQTRCPLKAISTIQRFGSTPWSLIYLALGEKVSKDDPLLLRCMKYWYYWNLEVEKIAQYQYCVENMEQEWNTICELIERPELRDKMPDVRKNVNSKPRKYTPRTWADLEAQDAELCAKIKEQGRKYGYKIS